MKFPMQSHFEHTPLWSADCHFLSVATFLIFESSLASMLDTVFKKILVKTSPLHFLEENATSLNNIFFDSKWLSNERCVFGTLKSFSKAERIFKSDAEFFSKALSSDKHMVKRQLAWLDIDQSFLRHLLNLYSGSTMRNVYRSTQLKNSIFEPLNQLKVL